jgi:hypothetical protein
LLGTAIAAFAFVAHTVIDSRVRWLMQEVDVASDVQMFRFSSVAPNAGPVENAPASEEHLESARQGSRVQ